MITLGILLMCAINSSVFAFVSLERDVDFILCFVWFSCGSCWTLVMVCCMNLIMRDKPHWRGSNEKR